MKLADTAKLFTDTTQFGAEICNRRNRGGGTYMDIGSLCKSSQVQRHENIVFDSSREGYQWIKSPMFGERWTIEVETFIPFNILEDFGENQPTHIGRLEGIMLWNLTYNELVRHCSRMELIEETQFYKMVYELLLSEKDNIHDLMIGYHQSLESQGDYSLEQTKIFVHGHRGSSSPFEVRMPMERRLSWQEIYDDETKLRDCWRTLIPKLHKWNTNYDKFCRQHDFKAMVKGDATYEAGRTRTAEYEITHKGHNVIQAQADVLTHRKADGVPILSQSELGVYKRKEAKLKVYAPFYDYIRRMIGITDSTNYLAISIDGMKLYEALCQGEWQSADISNAEKQIGALLWYVPYNGDMLAENHRPSVCREWMSGTGPTKLGADIVVAAFARILKSEYGLKFTSVAAGGDNFALKDSNLAELFGNVDQISFGLEDRCLGFNTNLKRFWPLHLTTDNVKHANNLKYNWRQIVQNQTIQYELRPLQSIVQNNLMQSNSCVRFISWAIKEHAYDDVEILDRNHFYEVLEEKPELRESFVDTFAEELEWLKSYIPTHNNASYPTNLNKRFS